MNLRNPTNKQKNEKCYWFKSYLVHTLLEDALRVNVKQNIVKFQGFDVMQRFSGLFLKIVLKVSFYGILKKKESKRKYCLVVTYIYLPPPVDFSHWPWTHSASSRRKETRGTV